ncbi:MAG: hypothetical protein KatS3mg102_0615 [Planctomycetota bacterium]|nr:MAG: hypothetical protein KatS3mg102_0615 [Planctomycetota bacterium]
MHGRTGSRRSLRVGFRQLAGARLAAAAALCAAAGLLSAASAQVAAPPASSETARSQYLEVHFPAGQRPLAERLLREGERALQLYARYLDQRLPRERLRCFLYATEAEYQAAEAARTGGIFKTNLAFTHAATSEVHMVIQPRLERLAGTGPGMLEGLFAHELAHALQYRVFPSYDEFPDWLSEGMAELFAERALGDSRHCAAQVPWFGVRVHEVLEALDEGRFVPVERLLTEGLVEQDPALRDLKYGEAWALCRFLDDPVNGEQTRFRDFVLEVARMPRGGRPLVEQARERFLALWPDVIRLERRLIAYLRELAPQCPPWQVPGRELRLLPDGGLVCESFPGNAMMALSTAPRRLGGVARIEAEVMIAPLGHRQADVFFAYRGPLDAYKVAFGAGNPPFVTLMRNQGGRWQSLRNENLPPGTLQPEQPVRITIDIDVARVAVRVGERPVLRYTAEASAIGGGRWGIGCYDGRAIFRQVSGRSY